MANVLETHAEWRAADVADTDSWTFRLSTNNVDELREALALARSRHDDVLDVTAADFPVPTLAPRLAELEHELVNGRGFARIRGIPVDGPDTYDDASWMYWGLGLHLGEPWPQNVKGHLLGDVRDQGKAANDPTTRGNELGGGAPQPFHTDGSDLVGLMCLHAGVSGGESRIANSVFAHNELVRTRPDLADILHQPLPMDFRGEQAPGGRPYYFTTPFNEHNDRLFIRYIRPYIQASQRHDEAPRLTAEQIEAMDAFDALINDPDNQVEMLFEPGDAQFINNYHVLHGRRSYVDDADAGQVRFLKRLWLATTILTDDDRPEGLGRASMGHWANKRTKA